MNTGRAVSQIRQLRGLTQVELAQAINMKDLSGISKIERGKIQTTVKTLQKIAEALDVPLAAIYLYALDREDFRMSEEMYLRVRPLIKGVFDFILNIEK